MIDEAEERECEYDELPVLVYWPGQEEFDTISYLEKE